MANSIVSATLDVRAGEAQLYKGTLSFEPGLNIISGENGTGKTKLLQELSNLQALQISSPGVAPKIQSINPRRNSQRRQFFQVFNEHRKNDTKLENIISVQKINDASPVQYPSLGAFFSVIFEKLCRDGGDQIEKMNETVKHLNSLIGAVFENYELTADWNEVSGQPEVFLIKDKRTKVPLEGLSLGEGEVLSLICYLHSSMDQYDIYLIDEPEVHLNWQLEDKLFQYLDELCEKHQKQMIVVTHSRAAFKDRYRSKLQFLFWTKEGAIACSNTVSEETRVKIAGEAIEFVNFGNFTIPTFLVEDRRQEVVCRTIADTLEVGINITACGGKANVRSLYKYAEENSNTDNAYFVEDGDNEGSPFSDETRFIHLDRYCIESYLTDYEIASTISGNTIDQTKEAMLQAVIQNSDKIFKKNKHLDFLLDKLTVEDLSTENMGSFDMSEIFDSFVKNLDMKSPAYVKDYIFKCSSLGKLSEYLPNSIVEVIEQHHASQQAGEIRSL